MHFNSVFQKILHCTTSPMSRETKESTNIEDMMLEAWGMFDFEQKRRFVTCDAAKAAIASAGVSFDAGSLADDLVFSLASMESEIVDAGYTIECSGVGMYCWVFDDETSEDFRRADAIIDAHADLLANLEKEKASTMRPGS